MKIKSLFAKTTKVIAKNAPLGLTVAGVLGLGATAYLSFKSAKRFEEITDDLEKSRSAKENRDAMEVKIHDEGIDSLSDQDKSYWEEVKDQDVEVHRSVVIRNVAGAFAAPVITGTVSICAITLSYMMMNNRVKGLASALATASAESYYYHKKYENQYGEEEAKRFYTPTTETNESTRDENNKQVKVVTKDEGAGDLYGEWFDKSDNYVADDHAYNKAFITSVEEKMANKLFRNGYLVLNDLKDALGFERDRSGAVVGWTSGDSWLLDIKTVMVTKEDSDSKTVMMSNEDSMTGEREPQIYIHWPAPKYIYDNIEYTGRYSE